MGKISKFIVLLLFLCLAGCAELVEYLDDDVEDDGVQTNTSSYYYATPSSKQSYYYATPSSKQNEEKPQNPDNKKVAASQDKDPVQECLDRCFRIYNCDRVYSKYSERSDKARQDYIISVYGIAGSGSRGNLDFASKWSDNRERRMEREQHQLEEAVTRCDSNRERCRNDCQSLR